MILGLFLRPARATTSTVNDCDAANRLESVTRLGVTQPYTYSANGNLLQTGVLTNNFDAGPTG